MVKGVVVAFFFFFSFLSSFWNGKGMVGLAFGGSSMFCAVVLGYPAWSRAFTCTTIAERGVLVIRVAVFPWNNA